MLAGYPPIFRDAAKLIKPVTSVIDVGPGIRPQPFLTPERYVAIEPHGEYVKWLRDRGHTVMKETALAGLKWVRPAATIMMLDVIEHMERLEGLEVLRLACKKAWEQIVVYTPLGFYPQEYIEGEADRWGMDGGYWQTHRSGWTPDDFPGWEILIDPEAASGQGAFFAIFSA